MRKLQIELDDDQARRLGVVAAQRRLPVEELIRQAVAVWLGPRYGLSDEEVTRRALAVVGKFNSGLPDISVEHDRYLDEVYGSWQSSPILQDSSPSSTEQTTTTEKRGRRGKHSPSAANP